MLTYLCKLDSLRRMARKPRVEIEATVYHFSTRGNQRRDIFPKNSARVVNLEHVENYRKL